MFWFLLCLGIGVAMIALAWLLDRHQERPHGVSADDWQRVSEERERAHLSRVIGKP